MTDPWDERTEAIPGKKDERSIEIDIDTDDAGADRPTEQSPMAFLDQPTLLVFEPARLGVASALEQLGFAVKVGTTAVDVMSAVARVPPSAVVCAPTPEPERRRMLTAALRLRFPSIPVIYVSTHAKQEAAVLGAIREGARAVLGWPLPPAADVKRVLGPYLAPAAVAAPARRTSRTPDDDDNDNDTAPLERRAAASTGPDEQPTAPRPRIGRDAPASDEGAGFEDLATAVLPPVLVAPRPLASRSAGTARQHAPPVIEDLPSDAMRPLPVPLPLPPPRSPMASLLSQEPLGEPPTVPGLYRAGDRGEVGELLDAISPFLWSLEDAARWAELLAARGDPEAKVHARTLETVSRILEQLRARVDESGA